MPPSIRRSGRKGSTGYSLFFFSVTFKVDAKPSSPSSPETIALPRARPMMPKGSIGGGGGVVFCRERERQLPPPHMSALREGLRQYLRLQSRSYRRRRPWIYSNEKEINGYEQIYEWDVILSRFGMEIAGVGEEEDGDVATFWGDLIHCKIWKFKDVHTERFLKIQSMTYRQGKDRSAERKPLVIWIYGLTPRMKSTALAMRNELAGGWGPHSPWFWVIRVDSIGVSTQVELSWLGSTLLHPRKKAQKEKRMIWDDFVLENDVQFSIGEDKEILWIKG